MRLIDADALWEAVKKELDIEDDDHGACFVGYQQIKRVIDGTPTADEAGGADVDEYLDRIKVLETTVKELKEINEEYAYGERGQEYEIERCRRLIDALKVEAEATRRVAVESIVAMAMEGTDD